jgi:hypothetical protein
MPATTEWSAVVGLPTSASHYKLVTLVESLPRSHYSIMTILKQAVVSDLHRKSKTDWWQDY